MQSFIWLLSSARYISGSGATSESGKNLRIDFMALIAKILTMIAVAFCSVGLGGCISLHGGISTECDGYPSLSTPYIKISLPQ